MRQTKLFVFLVIAGLLASTVPLSAQSWAGRGRLQGEIRDEQGKPIEGATITLRKGTERVDPKVDGPKPITTNKHGKWSTLGLGQGAWGILIEKEGYMPSEGQVQVNEFAVAQPLNITLKPIPKEVMQQAEQASGNAQAKAAFEKGISLLEQKDPAIQVSVLRAIADSYSREGNTEQAIASLKRALEIDPNDVASLQVIATVLVNSGQEKEAEPYIARLPEGTKIDPNSMLNVGIKLYNDKDFNGAVERFDRVVKENPELATAYYYRGLAYLALNKTAEAKADFQKLLELEPNHPNAADAREFIKSL